MNTMARAGIPVKEGLRPAVYHCTYFLLFAREGIPLKEGLRQGRNLPSVQW